MTKCGLETLTLNQMQNAALVGPRSLGSTYRKDRGYSGSSNDIFIVIISHFPHSEG